jgi:hypothetical protein
MKDDFRLIGLSAAQRFGSAAGRVRGESLRYKANRNARENFEKRAD